MQFIRFKWNVNQCKTFNFIQPFSGKLISFECEMLGFSAAVMNKKILREISDPANFTSPRIILYEF